MVEPLESGVLLKCVAVELFIVALELLSRFEALAQLIDILDHDAVSVLFQKRVIDVGACRLAVRKLNRSDFHEVLDLPQAGVVFGDILDNCDTWRLRIQGNI